MASGFRFVLEGRLYKGNLHTHTTHSDGRLDPREAVALYRDKGGYDFLAITDHGVVAPVGALSTSDFVAVEGAELHPSANELGFDHHFLCVGLPEAPADAKGMTPQETLDFATEAGAACFLAHPYWHGCTLVDLLGLDGALGVEVFNTTCDVSIGKGDSHAHWDDLLARGKRVYGIAVDDAHFGEDYFGGWVMVDAPELRADALLRAIKDGRFYSSNGPEIRRLVVEGTRVELECSPVRSVDIISRGPAGRRAGLPHGAPIEQFECELLGLDSYFRIQLTDEHGYRAWTNPFHLSAEGQVVG